MRMSVMYDVRWTKAAEWAVPVPHAVFGVDAEGRLLYANAQWNRLAGSGGNELGARTADGWPLRILGTCRDVSGRRHSDEAPRAAMAAGGQPGAPSPPSAASILLVDDIQVNRLLARRMLERLGYHRITTACNGREALAACRAQHFDLILMDRQMPEMDGLQATRELRARGVRTPIIAFTSDASAADRDRFIEAGMNDHLCKPVDMAVLAQKVSHWLGANKTAAAGAAPIQPIGGTPAAFDREEIPPA